MNVKLSRIYLAMQRARELWVNEQIQRSNYDEEYLLRTHYRGAEVRVKRDVKGGSVE